MALACGFQRGRQFHLDVAGGVEDEGQRQHLGAAFCRAIEPFVEQYVGMLDEAHFDAPRRVALTPLRGKVQDFLVAVAVARTVAD